jgi:hypothetical protein
MNWPAAIGPFLRSLTPLGIVLAVLAALALAVGGWKSFDWFNDREAVQEDRDAHNAAVNADLRVAEGAAGGAKAARDIADAAEQDELEDMTDEADDAGDSPADDIWNGGLFDAPG